MLLLWQNGVHVDDASFAGCGSGFAGCGLTSAWFRSGWGRFDGRRGSGAHQGQGGDSVDDGDSGPDCCRVAGGAGEGIATTMMATLEVIQRAVAAGRNMIVTHEPTFWSHLDTTKELESDPTYEFKRRFIAEHDVAVFRFHDHWHGMKPDGINAGMTRELLWEKNAVSEGSPEFVFDVTTLGGLVETMVKRLNAHSMRVVGDAKMPVKRVVANWGYASLMPRVIKTAARPDGDVVICGETREWELVEYVQDQIAAGAKKALIVVNHVVSEQSGMRYCAEWLKPMVPEVPVEFMASKEPFWVAPS